MAMEFVDFRGFLRRLDYLHGLGTTAIWLMPFQNSPGRDDGHDICDYLQCGSALRRAGRFRGVHSRRKTTGYSCFGRSDGEPYLGQHPGFEQARSDPNSKFPICYTIFTSNHGKLL